MKENSEGFKHGCLLYAMIHSCLLHMKSVIDLIRRINTLNTEKKEWLIVNFITNRYILIKQKTFDNNTKCSLLISIRVLNLLLLLQSCDATHVYISGWKKNLAPWNQNFCVGMSRHHILSNEIYVKMCQKAYIPSAYSLSCQGFWKMNLLHIRDGVWRAIQIPKLCSWG